MAWFKIYVGLNGGFGGATYHGTYEYADEQEASIAAHELAVEEYQSYEGYHGIMSLEDCREDAEADRDTIDENEFEDMVENRYQEEIESWIEYYVRPATSEHDTDDEEA